MPCDWRKRLFVKLVLRGLRSYVEALFSNQVCGFACCRRGGSEELFMGDIDVDFSTSLLIARLNSAALPRETLAEQRTERSR